MRDRFGVLRFLGFGSGARRLWVLTTRQWLWIGVFASTIVQAILSVLYYIELNPGNTDLGVINMAMSSTLEGRVFFQSNAYALRGISSQLAIHFSWVYFAVLPIYAAFPLATTLFATQSVALAAAAIPLYYLAVDLTQSEIKGLATSAIYLAWAPLYIAPLHTSHLEPFLPVLLFGTFLFFNRGQFVLGLVLGTLAAFALDGMALFTALIGVFFLTFAIQAEIRAWRADRRKAPQAQPELLPAVRNGLKSFEIRVMRFLGSRPVQASLALIAISAMVFFLMGGLEDYVAIATASPGAAPSTIAISKPLGFQYITDHIGLKVEFWLILFATVGFLPLLSPRAAVILLLPWFAYTFLINDLTFSILTNPHVELAAFPLFIGVAFAMRYLPLDAQSTSFPVGSRMSDAARSSSRIENSPTPAGSPPAPPPRLRRGRPWLVVSVVFVAGLIVGNVAINPGDPLAERNLAFFGAAPFGSTEYSVTWTPPPGFGNVVGMSQLVPRGATALASVPLWTLLNFDPNAFPLGATSASQFYILPFNGAVPTYIFTEWTSSAQTTLASYPLTGPYRHTTLPSLVWNPAVYGVRAWAQSTPLGPVFLFENGYSGPAATFGSVSYPAASHFRVGSGLSVGAAGTLTNTTYNGRGTPAISSASDERGVVWTVTSHYATVPAGMYTASIIANVTGPNGNCSAITLDPTAPILTIDVGQSSANLFNNQTVDYGSVTCGSWSTISLSLNLSSPLGGLTLQTVRPSAKNDLAMTFVSVSIEVPS